MKRERKKRLLFIFNPNAGTGKIKSNFYAIIDLLCKSGYEIIVYATKGPGDAHLVAKEYVASHRCDRIICAGGDGTLDEVASGVMAGEHDVPIGYIPSGTTNDFAFTLGIPKSLKKAAQMALQEESLACDIGWFNGSYFTYTVSFGLFSEISYETPQNFKNMFGRLAYVLKGALSLPKTKSYHMVVNHDHGRLEGDFIHGMVSNSNSVGGFHGLTGNRVILDDGQYELILVKMPKNVADLTITINELLQHKFNPEHIFFDHVSKVTLTANEEVRFALDGEFGGAYDTAEIRIHKRAIRYICKR